jgi:hypothetical protein
MGCPVWIGLRQGMVNNVQGRFSQFYVAMRKQLFSIFYVRHFRLDLYFAFAVRREPFSFDLSAMSYDLFH